MSKWLGQILLLIVVGFIWGCSASNASFPSREVTLVVPVAPGGNSDFTSRLLAKSAEKYLGQKINVVNKPGGSATVGLGSVMIAKPDGYTIAYTSDIISILPHLGYADIKPDHFESILLVQSQPAALSVQADAPYKTISDFIQSAKSKPKNIAVANSGAGTLWHLAALSLEKNTQAEFKHVPFDGSTPALVALLGGHVDAAVTGPSEALPHVQAGKLRVLAVMDQQRFPLLKEIPTLKELGYDVQIVGWGGFVAPKGTAPAVVKALHDAFKKAFDESAVKEAYAARGLGYVYKNSTDFQKFAAEQVNFFRPLVANLPLKK